MKILFITHYSALYGANRSLLNLLEGFEKYPVSVCVVIPAEGEITVELNKRNIPYVVQKFNWWTGIKKQSPQNIKDRIKDFLLDRRREYQMHKLNKVHADELKLKLSDFVPQVVFSNSSVINFGYIFSRKYNLPHVWFLRESPEHYRFKWFHNKWYVQNCFNNSELVITVSNYLKNYYRVEIGIKRITTVYNGILNLKSLKSLDERKRESKKKILKTKMTFGILGVLHPKKGQAEAINAFGLINKEFPETKLIIAGLGDQTGLRELVKRIGLEDKVEFWGHIEDPFEAFLEMDVYLMCSRMEGLGRVTLEAMASGLPVIGYYEGGTKDIILENETGLFYKKDHEDLAEKMRYLIRNPELRLKFGNNARALVDAKYTSEVYAENVYNLIKGFDKN